MQQPAERYGAMLLGWRGDLLLPVLLGAVGALGQEPFALPLATIIALALALVLLEAAASPARAGLRAWSFALGYFAVSLSWLVSPFLVEPERTGWMAPFALFFMSAGLALFWALAVFVARRLGGGVILTGLALILAEYLRSVSLSGFPWALLGHIWIDTGLAQLARLSGPHGLTVVTVALAAALRLALRRASATRYWAALGVLALTIAAPVMVGALLSGQGEEAGADAPLVRVVQPNAAQRDKLDPEKAWFFLDVALAQTAAGPARPDLIVWPETSVPVPLDRAGVVFEQIAAAARGAPVAAGIQRIDGASFYNSLAIVDGSGAVAGVYDKAHLVPFGEYIPFPTLWARFGLYGLAASEGGGFSAGPGPQIIEIPGIGAAQPLICYEGIFAEEVGSLPARPRLLLLVTNDAWFGSFSGPYQHLAQARLRAIEQGVPMVRAANTGVSAIIDARGKLVAQIGLGEAGYVDAPLPATEAPTLYARTGDGPLIALLLSLFAALALRARYRQNS